MSTHETRVRYRTGRRVVVINVIERDRHGSWRSEHDYLEDEIDRLKNEVYLITTTGHHHHHQRELRRVEEGIAALKARLEGLRARVNQRDRRYNTQRDDPTARIAIQVELLGSEVRRLRLYGRGF